MIIMTGVTETDSQPPNIWNSNWLVKKDKTDEYNHITWDIMFFKDEEKRQKVTINLAGIT